MSEEPPARRGIFSRETVLSLYFPAAILSLGTGIAAPALPVYARSFDISFGVATLVVIVNQIGAAAATLPTGWLVDHVGRRRVLLAGPLLEAVSALLIAQAHSFPELLVYRFMGGWAQQMWMLARLAIITDVGAQRQRGRQITGMMTMDSAGRLLGPAVGGFLAAAWDIRVPFVAFAILSLLSIIPSFKLVQETAPSRSDREAARGASNFQNLSALLIFPVLMLFVAQAFASLTRGTLFGGTLNLYAVYAYNIGPETIGIIATIAGAIGIPITLAAGFLMDRFGRKASVVPGFSLLGGALALMAATAYFQMTFLTYVVVFLMVQASQSLTSGNMQVIGSDVAPPHLRGQFFGIWQLIAQIAALLSPAIFAFLAETSGYTASFVFLSTSALTAAFVLATQVKETVGARVAASDTSV